MGCGSSNATQTPDSSVTVNPHISAGMIEGNTQKYLGSRVRLRCTITSVPDPTFANADCGPTLDSLGAAASKDSQGEVDVPKMLHDQDQKLAEDKRDSGQLVIMGSVSTLDAQERVIITGYVGEMNGTSSGGVSRVFPAVHAEKIVSVKR